MDSFNIMPEALSEFTVSLITGFEKLGFGSTAATKLTSASRVPSDWILATLAQFIFPNPFNKIFIFCKETSPHNSADLFIN